MTTQLLSSPKPELEQLKFLEAPIAFDLWRWRSCLRGMSKAHADMQWEIGDLLVEAKEYGQMDDNKLRQEAWKETKREWGTLKNYMVAARAIPPSRRRDGKDGRPELPFSLHVEVAQFEAEHQERLLRIAGEGGFDPLVEIPDRQRDKTRSDHPLYMPRVPGKILSVRELKSVIATMQDWGQLPKSEAVKRRQEKAKKHAKEHALKIRISDDGYKKLERFSNAKYGRPYYRSGHPKQFERDSLQQVSNLLCWMAGEYFKEHKANLEAMVAAADAKDAADKEETRKRVEENEQEKKERLQPGLRLQRIWALASEDGRTRALSSAFDAACKENRVRDDNAAKLAAMTEEERSAVDPENHTM